MPTVPRYDSPQVGLNPLPGARVDGAQSTAQFTGSGGRQMQQLGEAVTRVGRTAADIALDAQNEANQLRVIDARNQAKERMFDLLYHHETGLFNQRGDAALRRSDGKDLATEYGERFGSVVGEISATLGNDAQRQAFMNDAAAMRAQLHGDAQRHQGNEFRTFKSGTLDAAISTAQREIALAGASGNISINQVTGRTTVDDAADRITAAAREKARMAGMPQEAADVEARRVLSNAHALAVLESVKAKPDYASRYFARYRDQMDADDLLRVQGQIEHHANSIAAQGAVTQAERAMLPAMQPSDMSRLENIVLGMESGGRRYGKDGRLLESEKGAKGEMQVMDSTNKDPGYGVVPARDDSPDERARVGRDYLRAMVKRYGDTAQALAAYNAGPGKVDAALKAADTAAKLAKFDPAAARSWADFMPEETLAYVKKGIGLYGSGGGMPQRPTEKEFVDTAVGALGPGANGEQVKMVADVAKHRFALIDKDVKQREEAAVLGAQEALWQNGGNFAALPAEMVARIPADKRPGVMDYAGRVAKGPPTETDPAIYYALSIAAARDPAGFAEQNLTGFFDRLAPAERKHFIDLQAKMGRPEEASQVVSATQQIEATINALGFKHEQAGIFTMQATKALFAAQQEKGRALNQDERQKELDRLVLKGKTPGWPWGSGAYAFEADAAGKPFTPEYSDTDVRKATAALQRRGVTQPSKEQITAVIAAVYGKK